MISSRLMVSVLAAALIVLMAGCGSKKVSRVDPDKNVDLSGDWNDVDSRLVAEEMIKDCLDHDWLSDHKRSAGKNPTVIAGSIRNKSLEHIATNTFLKDIERAMINSGDVQVVASSEERGEVRDERADQQVNASPETLKQMGREMGADYMLLGEINQINDAADGEMVKYYQTDLQLVNIETNVKVWLGQKKIKKMLDQPSYGP